MIASVVVPAHNEASVLGRCLAALLEGSNSHEFEVVVVCNGCTDASAEIARSFAGVKVEELATASKTQALNAGDALVSVYPRIYLDADTELSAEAARELVAEAAGDRPMLVAPVVDFDIHGASWIVRSFYRAFCKTPFMRTAAIGRGVYVLNAAGRARFDVFPDIVGDDVYVYSLFGAEEQRLVSSATCRVRIPRRFKGLINIRTRSYYGNSELSASDPSNPIASVKALLRQLRSAMDAIDAVVYVSINVLAKLRARRRQTAWLRDESSRQRL